MRSNATVSVWCLWNDIETIKSWSLAQFRGIIWSNLFPAFEDLPASGSHARFDISLDHGGDIQDEECLAIIVIRLTKIFEGSVARIQTTEGDLLLIETLPYLSEDIEFPEEISIVSNGDLYHISEDVIQYPIGISAGARFDEPIQGAFHQFCDSIAELKLYHTKTLLVPRSLKRLLIYDRNLIAPVVRVSALPKSLKVEESDFTEYPIKFRRFQFALLESIDIRVPRSFVEKCGDRPLRYVKLSFLLTIGFQNLVKDQRIVTEIQNSQMPELDSLMSETNPLADDDESWLDPSVRPPFNFEEVGSEMAERMASFVEEISDFEKVESSGPLNFDFDIFKERLEHFMDSSESAEEEEEEEIDELLEHLDDDEEKMLRRMADGKADASQYVQGLLERSVDSQIDGHGPAGDLLNIFDLRE
jgi:hypothetical protein